MMRSLLFFSLIAIALAQSRCPPGQPSCDVGVAKAGPSEMIIGFARDRQYQINIPNAGPNDAFNVIMVDNVPPPLSVTFVDGSYSNGTIFCTRNGNRVECTIPLLRGGDTARVLVNVTIPSNAAPANITNTAFVNSTTCDNDLTNNQNSAESQVKLSADLTVDINGPSFGIAGQSDLINQTITINNLGSSDAQSVVATFFVPAPLAFVAFNAPGASCSFDSATRLLTCQYGTVRSNETRVYSISVRVPPDSLLPGGGTVTFVARVTSTTPDPNLINNMDTHDLLIQINSNLSVTKSGPTCVVAGVPTAQFPAFYTIVVDNSGPSDGFNVTMYDQFPSQFQLLSVVTTCNQTLSTRQRVPVGLGNEVDMHSDKRENIACGRVITCTVNSPPNYLACNIDYVAVSERVLAIVAFAVPASTLPSPGINNTAHVVSLSQDSDSDRNQDSHVICVTVDGDVQVTKDGPTSIIISGDGNTYYYDIVVKNNGPSIARGVTLVDQVPPPIVVQGEWIQVPPLKAGANCQRTGNYFNCSFGDLNVGESVAFRYAFTVPANAQTLGAIQNWANITSTSFDSNPLNNKDDAIVTVVAAPDVAVIKNGPPTIFVSGNRTTYYYQIDVYNYGPSDAQNVRMEDSIPTPFILDNTVQITTTQGTCAANGNFVNCTIGYMPNGAVVRIVVPFYVPGTATQSNVTNIARIFHTTPDRNTTNNEYPFNTILIRLSDIAVAKTGPSVVCAGGPQERFTVTVTNLGPADAQGITLDDVLLSQFIPGNSADITIVGNQTFASCSFVGQRLSCSLGGLAFGGEIRITYPFRIASSTPAQLAVPNRANASVTGNDPNIDNNEDTHNTDICNNAPLGIVKTGPLEVVAGGNGVYQYTLVVRNINGPSDAVNAVVSDSIPSQWTYVNNSVSATGGGSCNVTNGIVSCSWPRFTPGQSQTVTFSFTVNENVVLQTVQNCALFWSATPPNVSTNPVNSCFNTTVRVSADVDVTKTGPTEACAGDGITWYYTVHVRNNGPSRARNIQLTDPIPGVLVPGSNALISVTGAEGATSCAYSGNTLSCSLGELRVGGGPIVIRFPFTVPASVFRQTVDNVVTVSSSFDTVASNNVTTFPTPICNVVDLVAEKTGPATVSAGSPNNYTYNLAVSNLGPSDAINVTLRDPIDTRFRVVGNPVPSGAGVCSYTIFNGQTSLNCQWPRIVPNVQRETVSITFQVPVDTPPGNVPNCVFANSTLYVDKNITNNQVCINTMVDVEADLTVTKIGPASICAASTGAFELRVTNNGPAVAFNANLTDNLPSQFVPVAGSITITGNVTAASCSFSGLVLTCQLGRMDVGTVIFVRYSVSVPASTRPTPSAVNNVVVNASTPDGSSLNNHDSHSTAICAQADLRATKSAPAQAVAGTGGYIYSLTITNAGPADASSATLVDVVPVTFPHGDFISTGTGVCVWGPAGTSQSNDLSCSWAGLFRVNQSETISFYFSVPATAAAGQVNNCVEVASSTEDPVPSNNRACNSTNVVTQANVGITKNGPSSLCAGDPANEYVSVITNAGPSVARSVTVSDPLPSGLTAQNTPAVSITGAPVGASCSYNGNTLGCNLLDLPAGASVTIRFPFRVFSSVSARNVTNVITVRTDTPDSDSSNQNARFDTQIRNCVDLSVLKTAPSASVIAGSTNISQFQITVQNKGPSDATNVVVTDPNILASDVTVVGASATNGGTCTITNSSGFTTVSCSYPVLTVGASSVITISFTSPASANPGQKENCALVTSSSNEVNPGDERSCANFTIQATADLVTTKQCVPGVVYAGENVGNQLFVLTVTNIGGSDARGSSLVDQVNPIFTVTSVSSTFGSCSFPNNRVSCQFGTIIPNQSVTVNVTYTTKPDAPLGSVPNQACAATTTLEINQDNNCGSCNTEVRCRTALSVTKVSNITSIVAGSSTVGSFLITVRNGGPSVSDATQVIDTWDNKLSYYPNAQDALQPSQGSCTPTATGFFCNLGRLNPNETATVTVRFQAPQIASDSTAINQACAKNSCVESVCATAPVSIIRRAELVIVKDDCVSEVLAGNPNTYTFTISVYNAGPSNAANVVVEDTWPSVYTRGDVNAPGGVCIQIGNGGFRCTFASLPALQYVYITATYTVADSVLPGYATNCAVVSSSTPENDSSDNQGCDTNRIITLADLDIRKTIDSDVCVVAGSNVQRTYTLTVTNLGPSIARAVQVFERFPTDLTLLSFPPQCQRTPATSSNFTCALGDMRRTEQRVLLFVFRVDASHRPGIVENFASTWSQTPDPEPCNNNATLCSLICTESDLGVNKTDNQIEVTAGDLVTYTYQIVGTNYGPSDAPTVDFTDSWPIGIPRGNIVVQGATCTNTSVIGNFRCTVTGGLRVGATFRFNVTYTVPACFDACEICNTVAISSTTTVDNNSLNNVATDCTKVRTEADLEICKSDGYTTVVAGDGILREYTLVVTNNGPSCAQKVRVVDHFPREVQRVGVAIPTQGSCVDTTNNDFSCHLLTLQPGQTVIIKANYTVPSTAHSCSVTNLATVSSTTYDPRLCNNDAKDVNALTEDALLTISKTDGLETLPQSDTSPHTYTIRYTNNGPSTARDVVLTDRWPGMFVQFLETVSASNGTRCMSNGFDFTCLSGDLAVGASVIITARYSLMADSPCNTTVTNRVSVFSPTDSECRHAEDTTLITCVSRTRACLNCMQIATQNGQCAAQFTQCRQNTLCNACINSVLANPTQPIKSCFSDPTSCAMMACVYNDACGLGRGGPCDSHNNGPVLCTPLPQRNARSLEENMKVEYLPTSAPIATQAPGKMFAPKMMSVEAALSASKKLSITLMNPLKREVHLQDVQLQVSYKNGKVETVELIAASAFVRETTCENVSRTKLLQNWTYECKATLVPSADVKSIKVVARGQATVQGGYRPVLGYKVISM